MKVTGPRKPLVDTDGATAEAILTPLIRRHGLDAVLALLETQSATWPAYQRARAIARNVAARQERDL